MQLQSIIYDQLDASHPMAKPKPFTVETIDYRHGGKDQEFTSFCTMEAAIRYAASHNSLHCRTWVNGVEWTNAELRKYIRSLEGIGL